MFSSWGSSLADDLLPFLIAAWFPGLLTSPSGPLHSEV